MKNTKYKEIFAVLQQELCDGKYGDSRQFPSEAQLVRRFGVSRFTAVRAVSKLVEEGLIVRRKGKGSFPTKFARTAYGPIGLIMPGLSYGEIYSPICGEITSLCQRRGRTVLLGNTSAEMPMERASAVMKLAMSFVQQHVAGVIMHPIEYLRNSTGVNSEIVSILEKAGVPVVLLDYDIEPSPGRSRYDLICIDNFAAGRRMGEHLISVGVDRVLFVKRKNCAPTIESRMQGLAAAMVAAGKPWSDECVIEAEPTASGAVVRHLHGVDAPDAVVCGYDMHAASVLKAIERTMPKGTVPSRVKLAGFDDVHCASVMTPSLTTVHQPCELLARVAVEMLYRRMEFPDRPACTTMLDAPLVIRESTLGLKSALQKHDCTSRGRVRYL